MEERRTFFVDPNNVTRIPGMAAGRLGNIDLELDDLRGCAEGSGLIETRAIIIV